MQLSTDLLESGFVHLEPLNLAEDGTALKALAEELGARLFSWPYYVEGEDWVSRWFSQIETRVAAGTVLPFAVRMRAGGPVIGMTSYLSPDPASKTVEIGMTMYAAAVHGTAINPATKRLMLGHAFDHGAERVQFNVDARNERSRAAVLKLGAVQEGILRRHRKLADGFQRDTVVYSVLASEWPDVRAGLDRRLSAFRDQVE